MVRRRYRDILLIGCLAILVSCGVSVPTQLAIQPSPARRDPTPKMTAISLTRTAVAQRNTARPPRPTIKPSPSLTSTPLPPPTALSPTIPAAWLTTLAQIPTSRRSFIVMDTTLNSLPYTAVSVESPWTVWHTSNVSNYVTALATQADRIWASTASGLRRIDPQAQRVEKYDERIGRNALLLPIENGQMWAGSDRQLFFFNGQNWRGVTLPYTLTYGSFGLSTMAIDAAAGLLLHFTNYRGWSNTAYYGGHLLSDVDAQLPASQNAVWPKPYDCQQWPSVVSSDSENNYYSGAECLAIQAALQVAPLWTNRTLSAFDADGSLWSVNRDNGEVDHWSNGQWSVITLPDARISAVTADPSHGVWIGTDRGLMYTDGQAMYQLPSFDRHVSGGIPIDLVIDSSGAAWVLTNESKLSWLPADQSVQDFKVLSAISARAFATAADGIWITHGTDLIHLKIGERIPHAIPLPEADCKLDRLTTAPNGDVWATSRCGSVWQYQPALGHWIRHVVDASTPDVTIFEPIESVVAGTDGRVYAIGPNGLAVLTEPGGTSVGGLESSGDTLPYSIYRYHVRALAAGVAPLSNGPSATDRHGGFWLTTTNRGNLWHYADGQFTTVEHPFSATWLTALYVDQADQLWVANLYGQLALYDGQQWSIFDTPGIGTVYRIASAPDGRLWFAGNQGVTAYDPAQDKLP